MEGEMSPERRRFKIGEVLLGLTVVAAASAAIIVGSLITRTCPECGIKLNGLDERMNGQCVSCVTFLFNDTPHAQRG